MLVEVHDWELVDAEVEELERPIAASRDELILIDLGPGQVVERIVGVEPVPSRTQGQLAGRGPRRA